MDDLIERLKYHSNHTHPKEIRTMCEEAAKCIEDLTQQVVISYQRGYNEGTHDTEVRIYCVTPKREQ